MLSGISTFHPPLAKNLSQVSWPGPITICHRWGTAISDEEQEFEASPRVLSIIDCSDGSCADYNREDHFEMRFI
jgi:hypothetical protein